MKYNTDEIKAINPILIQMEKYGLRLNSRGYAFCPFHNEKTPSFKVYPESNTYYCFGCGESGDVITFVQKIENISFEDACERLYGKVSFSQSRKIRKISREQQNKQDNKKTVTDNYWRAFDEWLYNESLIECTRPSSSEEPPLLIFLNALAYRRPLELRLETAESEYIRKG